MAVVRVLGVLQILPVSIFVLSLELLPLTRDTHVHHAQRVVERAYCVLLVERNWIGDTATHSSQCRHRWTARLQVLLLLLLIRERGLVREIRLLLFVAISP